MSLLNSRELESFIQSEQVNDVSIRFGIIGAGQKGNKDADIFAGYKFSDGTQCYPTLAINFAQSDMMHLKNIPEEDRIHFKGMKGAARTPSLVVEQFDPDVSDLADERREELINAFERKFSDVDHLIISLGAGGGVGTGFGSLTLNLIKEEFFPVPVTLLISLPFDDPDEISNALLLLNEIQEFMRIQDEVFEPGEQKPLASVILTDNKKLYNDFAQKKQSKRLSNANISWKDEGNDVIVSTIHEANLIPANYGSDNVTYDPSDFTKIIQLSGKFLTFAKARIEPEFTIEKVRSKMKASIERGYFSCGHQFRTATMYGGFVLRPSNAEFFKDITTEQVIKDVISEFNPIEQMRGKYGDPIWNEDYGVIYTIFAGMTMPTRYKELAEELEEIRKIQKQKQESAEVDVDISAAIESVRSTTFNPYAKQRRSFGGKSTTGFSSVFSRQAAKEEVASSEDETTNTKKETSSGKTRRFGDSDGMADKFAKLRNSKLKK